MEKFVQLCIYILVCCTMRNRYVWYEIGKYGFMYFFFVHGTVCNVCFQGDLISSVRWVG